AQAGADVATHLLTGRGCEQQGQAGADEKAGAKDADHARELHGRGSTSRETDRLDDVVARRQALRERLRKARPVHHETLLCRAGAATRAPAVLGELPVRSRMSISIAKRPLRAKSTETTRMGLPPPRMYPAPAAAATEA